MNGKEKENAMGMKDDELLLTGVLVISDGIGRIERGKSRI